MCLGFPISLKFGSNLSNNAVKFHVIFHNYTTISTPNLAAPSRLPKRGSHRSLIFDPNRNLLRWSGMTFQPPRPKIQCKNPKKLLHSAYLCNGLPRMHYQHVMWCDVMHLHANGLGLCQWPPFLPMASGYPSRKIRLILCLSYLGILTHCGLVMPHDDLNLCQHWLR